MSHFTLTTGTSVGTTSISNIFLDEYMPGANGEYVKVYLYLLRSLGDSTRELSVIGLADVLDCTESDILRAFKYWEKQGLLKLECNASNVLLGIYLCEPSHLRTTGQPDRHASVTTPVLLLSFLLLLLHLPYRNVRHTAGISYASSLLSLTADSFYLSANSI